MGGQKAPESANRDNPKTFTGPLATPRTMEYGLVVGWWVLFVAIAVAGLPVAAVVFRALPDRGTALALPLALVVLFLPIHWVGQLRFNSLVVALGVLVLAAASVVALRRSPELQFDRFGEWLLVFTLAYLLLVAVRAVDPSILPTGGEKFLDYGLLTSLLRASSLPPEDFWFAGQSVQYYYGGQLLAASLAMLSGTAAKYAYNLALAGFYAALVGAAYGLAGSVAVARGHSYRLAGGLGAFFVGLASNVVPALQAAVWALPASLSAPLARAVAVRTAIPVEPLRTPEAFSYWTASRVIPGTINEFPLFAFVNGDLHAHMLSTPFLLLVVGICLAYTRTLVADRRRRRLLLFGAIPPVAGTLAVVNTWSLPTAAGLAGLTVLFAEGSPRHLLPAALQTRLPSVEGGAGELLRMGLATVTAAIVAALGVVWALPFVLGPATGATGRSIGLLPDRSGLLAFLLVHGWFVLVYAVVLLVRTRPSTSRRDWRLLGVGAAVSGIALLANAAAVAVLLPLLALAWHRLRRDSENRFEAVLFVAGAGLVLAVEFVYLSEQAGPGRFNTVFKTYMQVWVLWATGAGVALAALISRARSANARRGWLATAFAVLLVASASVYGVAALGGHFDDAPEATLDATANARAYHAAEWEAIEFLDAQPGRPTIASAPACWCNPGDAVQPYDWANAPSTFTGIPTVAGWSHEVGYRGEAPYQARVAGVRVIYTGSAAERDALLGEYDVEYLYVGPNERALYGNVSYRDAPGLTVVFENDDVTIYAVNESG